MNYNQRKLNKKKIITLVIVILIIVLIVVFGTLYEKNINIRNFFDKYIFIKEKYQDDAPQILTSQEDVLNSYAYNGNILILEDNLLKAYNERGKEEYELDIQITIPIFQSSGDYLCIAEKDGQKIYVISNKEIIWQNDLEGNISNIAINSNGYVAVSVMGTSYKTIIQTFDNKGESIFKMLLSSTYAIDIDISPDNKHLAIAETNFAGILIQSNIKIISMEKAKNDEKDAIEYTHIANGGDLIINIKYQSKDELTCIYDNHIEVIKNQTNETIVDFKIEEMLFADLNNKIIQIIKENSQVYLEILNAHTKGIKKYEINEPKEMCVSDDVIAINLGSEILFYNNSGWLIKKYYAKQEINKIVLCDNLAGIIYNDKIELISL